MKLNRTRRNGPDLNRLAPPGFPPKRLLVPFALLLAGLVFYGLGLFFANWSRARGELFAGGFLLPGAEMRRFWQLGGGAALRAFRRASGLFFPAGAALCYSHYFRGTKSHYLMRRLPDPLEWHWRALNLPLLLSLLLQLAGVLLVVLTFLFYLAATPAGCLPAESWGDLWRVLKS